MTNRRHLAELFVQNDGPSLLVAYFLWLIAFAVGAHRFYLGKSLSALIQLSMFWVGILASPEWLWIWSLWMVIDLLLIPAIARQRRDQIRRKFMGA